MSTNSIKSLIVLFSIILWLFQPEYSIAQYAEKFEKQVPAYLNPTGISIIREIVIYRDSLYYSAFPSIVKRPDGEVLVAFRRAPDRRLFGETGISHTDPNSYLMLVRSSDANEYWSSITLIPITAPDSLEALCWKSTINSLSN